MALKIILGVVSRDVLIIISYYEISKNSNFLHNYNIQLNKIDCSITIRISAQKIVIFN